MYGLIAGDMIGSVYEHRRVAAVGHAFDSLDLVLSEARRTAVPTHDHPEGIRGAQAVARAVLLRCIVPGLGAASDTLAAIAGSIAEAFYGAVPEPVVRRVRETLPHDLQSVLEEFVRHYRVAARFDASPQILAGPLQTDDEDSDFSMGSNHAEGSVATPAAVRDSAYFQHNVGFMPSDAVDVSSMTPVEVDAISDASPAGPSCGSPVPEPKQIVISTPAMHVQRASEVARMTGAQACIPDFLLFLNLHNVYESLRFFLHTADAVHVLLDDFPLDDIGRATRHSTSAADRKEALQTRSAMVRLINQVYWSARVDRATWYTSDPAAAMELLGHRVAARRVKVLPA